MAWILDDNLPEILPCPFCGREPALQKDIRYPRSSLDGKPKDAYEVVCNTYDCILYHVDNNYWLKPESAIKAWNKRALSRTKMNNYDFSFDKWLRMEMKKRNLRQIDVSQMSGVSLQEISNYVRGLSLPTMRTLLVLLEAFNMHMEFVENDKEESGND